MISDVIGAQRPRIHLAPAYVSSAGVEALEIAEIAGVQLDGWQKLVLIDALGETPEGRWAAFRIGLEVARQNGKDATLEVRELSGLFAFGERLIIHSAHEQATATEHFNRVLNLMEGVPEFDRRILKVTRGKGQEHIQLRDGYRIFFKTRTGGGGRGFTGDLVVLNEAMILASAFMGALVPTMAARSITGDPQLWFVGSAVDQQTMDHGVEFARVRKDALARVERLAYFGWNVGGYDNPDDVPAEVLDDPEAWAQANPGLGIRIAETYVADERSALGPRQFAVERLGVGDWPATDGSDGRVISAEQWAPCADPDSVIENPVCLAVEVTPDRNFSAIASAGMRADGLEGIEVLEMRPGTDWVAERLAELKKAHKPIAILCNDNGPAGALIDEIEKKPGLKVTPVKAGEAAQACGMLYDAVDQARVRYRAPDADLDAAVAGAVKRTLGETWAWSQRTSLVNISPLVACTLALWGLRTKKRRRPRAVSLSDALAAAERAEAEKRQAGGPE